MLVSNGCRVVASMIRLVSEHHKLHDADVLQTACIYCIAKAVQTHVKIKVCWDSRTRRRVIWLVRA